MKFEIEKSEKHTFEYGEFFLSKLVNKSSDELLGLESKKTYYVWGTKELSGTIELNPEDYIIKSKPFTTPEGAEMQLDYIVAKK